MAKHRFPIRIRAAREGIKSGRRLAITGAVVLAMGAAGAGLAMASTASPPAPATISASTSVSNHPDTTSGGTGTACNIAIEPSAGPVWAFDNYDSTLTAVNVGGGQWKVTIQDKGSFAGFADPNTCDALRSKGSLLGLYTVSVTSANTPDPSNLHSSYSGAISTTQMVRDFFNDSGAAVTGGDYFFVYQGGNYVQTTSSLYGDVVASH